MSLPESLESATLKALLIYLTANTDLIWSTGSGLPNVGEIRGSVSFFSQDAPLSFSDEYSVQRIFFGIDAYGVQDIDFTCEILDTIDQVQRVLLTARNNGIPGMYRGQPVNLFRNARPVPGVFRQMESQIAPTSMASGEVLANYKARLVYDCPIARDDVL